MLNLQLKTQIDDCNRDYARVAGHTARHFFCPIRQVDEDVELIKGHVLSRSKIPNCSRAWVPQRKDVDGFFGTIESEFLKVFACRDVDLFQALRDPVVYKKVRPKLEFEGRNWRHYPRVRTSGAPSHPTLQIVGDSGEQVSLGLKVPVDDLNSADGKKLNVVIEKDFSAAAFFFALKSAHLTMFRIFGYRYALKSRAGNFLCRILSAFFEEGFALDNPGRLKLACEYRDSLLRMHAPLVGIDANAFRGTVEDKKMIALFDETDKLYAIGVIVRADADFLAVFLPTDHEGAEETYFDMLERKLDGLRIRPLQFVMDSGSSDWRWEIPPGPASTLRLVD